MPSYHSLSAVDDRISQCRLPNLSGGRGSAMADVVPDRRLPAAHLDQRGVGRHARNATDPMRRELAMASVAQLAAAPVRRRQTDAGSSSDSVVTLRPSTLEGVPLIIAGRDAVFRRFIGEGSVVPRPKYCIIVDGSGVAGAGRSEHRLPRLSRTPQARLCDPSGRAGAGPAEKWHRRRRRHVGDPSDNSPSIAIAQRHAFERVDDVEDTTACRVPLAWIERFRTTWARTSSSRVPACPTRRCSTTPLRPQRSATCCSRRTTPANDRSRTN